jgi:hypothetical protein
MYDGPKQNDALGTTNRGNSCESGLCALCSADCKGKCETWLSALLGRKLLYPRDFGETTAGSANLVAPGIGYHALRIQGYAYGARGVENRLCTASDVGIAEIDSQHQGFFKAAHRQSVLTRAPTNEELGPAAKGPARLGDKGLTLTH